MGFAAEHSVVLGGKKPHLHRDTRLCGGPWETQAAAFEQDENPRLECGAGGTVQSAVTTSVPGLGHVAWEPSATMS